VAKYKKVYAERLPAMFENGESVAEAADALGVCRTTFYKWVDQYPDFALGYEKGKQKSEVWWSRLGRDGAMGAVDIQPTVWIFNMKNRFNWRDKMEETVTMKSEIKLADEDRQVLDRYITRAKR
jgi:transposase